MATVSRIDKFGNQFAVLFTDGSRVLAYPTGNKGFYNVGSNSNALYTLQELGNQMVAAYDHGIKEIAYPELGTDNYLVKEIPVVTLIDTISPGHSVTNPGGTVASGWQWHIDNNSGRGGVDWNYNFANFTAPDSGTVSHFDVAGVGMVVRLILDTPAVRTSGQFVNDQYGPMTAIWFQHCSAAIDGHHNQGEVIGTSGNGYGAYSAHLHVHGMIDNGGVADATNRCNFWGFL